MYQWETRQIQRGLSQKNFANVPYSSLLGIRKLGEITEAIYGSSESCLDWNDSHDGAEADRYFGHKDQNLQKDWK